MLITYPLMDIFLLILGHICNSHNHQFCIHIGWNESHPMGPNAIEGFHVSGLLSCIHFNIFFWLKMSYFPLNTSEWSTVIHIFLCNELVPLSTILMNINASGWAQIVKMHFLDFLVFLQKTLSANISAPRRGREAIQYSKSLSGCPLCSQTSSSTWGSILRALEPQT